MVGIVVWLIKNVNFLVMFTKVCIFGVVIKRSFAILILFIYLPAIAGVGFSTHYCMGELKDTKLFSLEKQNCCDDEAEEENGCCSDDITLIKLADDQLNTDSRNPIKTQGFDLIVTSYFNYTFIQAQNAAMVYFAADTSPPKPFSDLNVLYCNFLI